jgi:hypothetical protein
MQSALTESDELDVHSQDGALADGRGLFKGGQITDKDVLQSQWVCYVNFAFLKYNQLYSTGFWCLDAAIPEIFR